MQSETVTLSVGGCVIGMQRLQSVLNAAARLIFHLRCSDHISDALICLVPALAAGSGVSGIQDRRVDP